MPEARVGAPGCAASSTAVAPVAERQRRVMVRLVFLLYVVVLVQGALRKWLLPEYEQVLFFAADPLVLLLYLWALRSGLWWSSIWSEIIAIWFVITLLLLLLQLLGSDMSTQRLLLAADGLRAYFFYLPLLFVIPVVFQAADLRRFGQLNLLLAPIIALLVYFQFYSSPTSWLNGGTTLFGGESVFHGVHFVIGHVRPAGLATSPDGQGKYVASALVFALAAWVLPERHRALPSPLLALCTAALVVCIALGGSRGLMLQAAMLVLALLIGSIGSVSRPALLRALLITSLFGPLALVTMPKLFPQATNAFALRWEQAAASEARSFEYGMVGRAASPFVDWLPLFADAPVLGYGLGLGGNAADRMNLTRDLPFAESGWERHVVDLGPLLGLGFILLRIALSFWLGLLALRTTRVRGDPLPLLLFAFVGPLLLIGPIAGNSVAMTYGWLFAGLCLASIRAAWRTPPPGPAPAARDPGLRGTRA